MKNLLIPVISLAFSLSAFGQSLYRNPFTTNGTTAATAAVSAIATNAATRNIMAIASSNISLGISTNVDTTMYHSNVARSAAVAYFSSLAGKTTNITLIATNTPGAVGKTNVLNFAGGVLTNFTLP